MKCLSCNSENLFHSKNYSSFYRITSDAKPFNKNGNLFLCLNCSLAQKKIDKQYKLEIESIYENYQPYLFSNGDEQKVFSQKSGIFQERSKFIYELVKKFPIEKNFNLIDIGCGNGVTLKNFKDSNLDLYGYEYDNKNYKLLSGINNFKSLFTNNIDEIEIKFDYLLMIHSLEHFLDPKDFLLKLRNLMHNDSLLLIQVIDNEFNPFDFLITDHVTHFTKYSLYNLIDTLGFEVIYLDNLISKEISLIVKKNMNFNININLTQNNLFFNQSIEFLSDINQVLERIKETNYDNYGIFGTSISSLWAYYNVKDKIKYFVDEDKSKIGKLIYGIPVIHPLEIKQNNSIIMPVAPLVSKKIISKYPFINIV